MSEWLPGTFEPKGPPVVNLFTNPSFEAGSGTVEVRRNRFPNPAVTSLASFNSTSGQSTLTYAGSSARWTLDTTNAIGIAIEQPSIVAGTVYRLLVRARASKAFTAALRIAATENGTISLTTSWDWYETTVAAGAGSLGQTGILLRPGYGYAIGDWVEIDRVLFAIGADRGGWFAGQSASPDADLTPSWTGAANASPSILSGVPVAGIVTNRCLAIRSSKFGGSMRIIPRDTSVPSSFAQFDIPASARASGTLLGTVHMEAPLTGSLDSRSRRLEVANPSIVSSQPANAAGSTDIRLTFADLTDAYRARFYHGGLVGSGDVYWTMAGLFEGVYDGPAFSGNTPSTDEVVYAWTGPVNGSPSTRQEMEAVMATIYGTLTDFGLQTLAPYKPVLKFTPSGPGVKGRKVFSGRPVEVPVASSGAFAVLLEPTDGVTPEVWYTVSIEYLNEGGQYTSLDILGYRLFVPAPGGAIGDLPGKPLTADTVLVGLNPPPPGFKGWWLYSPAEGEEMPADETGIGDLRMVA